MAYRVGHSLGEKMNTPTKITVSRIAIVTLLIIGLFIMSLVPNWEAPVLGKSGINLAFLIIAIVFIIASVTDFIDGYLARKNNQITSLGKFLDPVADKILVNSLVIFLIAPSLFAPYNHEQIVSFNMWCAIILIVRDIVVDALRFIAAQKKIVIAANIFGKAKTVLQMVAIVIVLLNGFPFSYFDAGWPNGLHIADIFVYLATLVSLLSGVIYVVQNRKVLVE